MTSQLKTQSPMRSDLIEKAGFPHSSRELSTRPIGRDPNGYYEWLGLNSGASWKDIQKAYRKLALMYHPEGSEPDKEAFEYLTQIYEVLSNPILRQEYDSTEPGTMYIGNIEMEALRQKHNAKEMQEIVVETLDIPDGFSYYGMVQESQLAQEWYEVILAAMYALSISGRIRLSINHTNETHIEPGLISVPLHIEPNYFVALRLVNRLKGN